MNWIGIVIVGFCLVSGVIGYYRGFAKMLISAISLLIITFAAALFEPVVANMISEYTSFDETVQMHCLEFVEEKASQWEIEERIGQIALIENMDFHETVKADMIENNNHIIYENHNVNSFPEYLANYLMEAILAGVSYLLAFAVAFAVVKIATAVLINVSEAPVISFVNRIAGFVLGFFKGMVLVCVICLVIMLFAYTETGAYLVDSIKADLIGRVFYEQNPIVEWIVYMIGR